LPKLKNKIEQLEGKTIQPGFWDDRKTAETIVGELSALKETVSFWEEFQKNIEKEREKLHFISEWEKEIGNEEPEKVGQMIEDINNRSRQFEKELNAKEIETFLNGPHDSFSATLQISSGAGGTDAADWAYMLLRMYMHFAQGKNWKVKLLHEHKAEEAGIKNAIIEISGKYAYGFLRFESGAHRLVRISPFDAAKRRHTSFAMVEVLPVLTEDLSKKIVIREEDIEVDTFRSSGPGGQNVNRRETAVRITHKPSKIVVECQAERLQGDNKRRALELLAAKLVARDEEVKREEMLRLRGEKVSTSWGNQIRSYVLHPYQMVKDHRTGAEEHNINAVLNGDLDIFIEAEINQFGGK